MNTQDLQEKMNAFVQKKDHCFLKKVIVFDEISSTNAKAKELARNNADEGTIVLAKQQISGRGRFDRVWESPKGGIYCSIILKPNVSIEKTTLLPLIAALAVAKAVQSFGVTPAIKWPNDVRINKKKIAGILLESEVKNNKLWYVVVGLGINVNSKLKQFSSDLQNHVTSLSHELHAPADTQQFLEELLLAFDMYYTLFITGNTKRILDDWRSYSDTLGKRVTIATSSGEITGKAIDINASGFLQVVTDAGEHKTLMSGDCLYVNEL